MTRPLAIAMAEGVGAAIVPIDDPRSPTDGGEPPATGGEDPR